MLNPAVSCGTAPVGKGRDSQGCGAAASGAGHRGWERAILPWLAGSQGITAGSLGMELVQGVGSKGVAAWGGLVCGEQLERPGLGKMKASADCGKK